MDVEKRLEKAEKLLKKHTNIMGSVFSTNKPMNELANEINEFLQPEIDFDKMPVGTVIIMKGDLSHFAFSREIGIYDSENRSSDIPENISLPDHQLSHIHKIKWPKDGNQPDFVNNDDLIYVEKCNRGIEHSLIKASKAQWKRERDWFAIINITDYIKL